MGLRIGSEPVGGVKVSLENVGGATSDTIKESFIFNGV